jgi:hypothetical protein
MAGFTVGSDEHLIRSELWSKELKQILEDELHGMKWVRIISDFPDGTTFTIPSIGQAETFDFSEGQAIKYSKMDTGEFQFSFDQYKGSAHAISEKFKRDSFYSSDVLASFVPRQHRALMVAVEERILDRANAGQTSGNANTINTASHRMRGSGTSNSIALVDFVRAQHALTKANVPLVNLVAIVDPSVAYTLQTQAQLMNLLSPQPMWEDVTKHGAVSGMKFRFNIYGFDVYISNYLPDGLSETLDGSAITNGVANMFFSAAGGDLNPIVGGFRQMPTVYSEFNKDLQQTEYLTIAEYGFKLYRPENMVIVVTDKTII